MSSVLERGQRDAAALEGGVDLADLGGMVRERKLRDKRFAPPRLLKLLYWIYECRLLHQLQRGPLPRHVGIILDGNRRYARRHGLGTPHEIYHYGAAKLDDVLDWCAALGITAVTLWVFSTENLKRAPAEICGILAAIEAKLRALAQDPFMHDKRIRVRAIGRLDILPESVVAAIRAAEAATAQYDSTTLTIAAAYGGREEYRRRRLQLSRSTGKARSIIV
jgi:short-chain Z-isoprenyl diphosphate synthase